MKLVSSKQGKITVLILSCLLVVATLRIMDVPVLTINSTGELSVFYDNMHELFKDADLIVEVEITSGKSFEYDDVAFTLSTANISTLYKGTNPNIQNLKILETGGVVNNIQYTFEENEVLKNNQRAVLFLKKYVGPVVEGEAFIILGEYQGKFVINEEGNIIHSNSYLSQQLKEIQHISQLRKLIESCC
ncbi:hypothetical protein [Paenibacillus agilis]|uniref:Uncharacterized protein n=1 Tax=Paenibacillus agilis TaxID=3020863 RepID=A0A559IKH1_9BACL|nr:hypothetical protein [Paenibacillus agilis]TVX88166.1 hypothetical protein FPZ44_19870 [Paenibacillus agilis]